MNALELARTAYASNTRPIRTDRATEYEALAGVTRKLRTLNPKSNFGAFVQALHENRHLWTLLAVDVADAENGLPDTLRAQIFYLAEFTFLHTSKVLAKSATVDTLIEINSAVMAGLRQNGAAT